MLQNFVCKKKLYRSKGPVSLQKESHQQNWSNQSKMLRVPIGALSRATPVANYGSALLKHSEAAWGAAVVPRSAQR